MRPMQSRRDQIDLWKYKAGQSPAGGKESLFRY